eukprot:352965-Chlamydomonas_euryale.AAC.23
MSAKAASPVWLPASAGRGGDEDDARLLRFRSALSAFEGTHTFHNFTPRQRLYAQVQRKERGEGTSAAVLPAHQLPFRHQNRTVASCALACCACVASLPTEHDNITSVVCPLSTPHAVATERQGNRSMENLAARRRETDALGFAGAEGAASADLAIKLSSDDASSEAAHQESPGPVAACEVQQAEVCQPRGHTASHSVLGSTVPGEGDRGLSSNADDGSDEAASSGDAEPKVRRPILQWQD